MTLYMYAYCTRSLCPYVVIINDDHEFKSFSTKCARVVQLFMSLARYYHSTTPTQLFTLKVHGKEIMFKYV